MTLVGGGRNADMVLAGAGFQVVVGVKDVELSCHDLLCSALIVT